MMAKIRQFNREYWWLTMGIGIPVLLSIAQLTLFFEPNFLIIILINLPLLAFWCIVAVLSVAVCIHSIIKKNPLKAALATISPLLLMSSFIFLGVVNEIAIRVHLFTHQSAYEAQIALKPKPRLLEFDETGLTSVYSAIVYDDSDEIILPKERQSKEFRSRINNTDLFCDGTLASPIWGHYYYVQAFC